MSEDSYDIITEGGDLGSGALAKVMSEDQVLIEEAKRAESVAAYYAGPSCAR